MMLSRCALLSAWFALQICLLFSSCGQARPDSDAAANMLAQVFDRFDFVGCGPSSGTGVYEGACLDEQEHLRVVPGVSFVFESVENVDDAVAAARASFRAVGCTDLMPEYPQELRYASTWQGTLYSDPFECAGIPLVFMNRLRDNGTSQYVVTIYQSDELLRQDYSLAPKLSPPDRE